MKCRLVDEQAIQQIMCSELIIQNVIKMTGHRVNIETRIKSIIDCLGAFRKDISIHNAKGRERF